jgi:UDP-glucose 4-epimerase
MNGDDYDTPDGTCVRDYVHVEDIADAHVQAIDRKMASGVFNLGTKNGFSNREIITAAERITGQTVNMRVGPRREGDPAVLTASADKWIQTSGWQPRFGLDSMITHAWQWYTQ